MAYSPEEVETLKEKILSALEAGHLPDWQRQFLTDVSARIGRYGQNARFSDKQISKLYEILSRRPKSPARHPRQHPSPRPVIARPRRRQRSHIGGAIAWEGRWFARRLFQNIAMFAMMMVGYSVYAGYQHLRLPDVSSLLSTTSPAYAVRPISLKEFSITDGDTIRIRGDARGTRLVGFNAPESIKPQCPQEGALGLKAKARLRQLASSATLELQQVPCSCAPGTEGTNACNYGRSCAILRADGRDIGQVLIAEGLAVPFVCGVRSCPPTPRPWCG